MAELEISKTLSLPLDFVTSTQAILAKKRVGKSYKASVQAEELLEAGQQVVVIDPTSAWWGLRSSADGRSEGFPITIFGGEHGDLPLEASAGEEIADAIVAERFSAILDLSLFSKGEEQRFCAAFLERLYRKNRDPLHLFIDEADVVAPQRPFGVDEAKTLGACQSIVRRGGIKGIGCTLITQRAQVVNKDVLSQVDMLTVLRMNHPKDLGAIDEWVAVHGDPALMKQMRATLPSLPKGDAWVWAPALDIFERVTFRDRRTFDSGATPKPGESKREPKTLAKIDLDRLGAVIAASVERVQANDPKALRARVAELEKQLAARPGVARVETRTIEKPILEAKLVDQLKSTLHTIEHRVVPLQTELEELRCELAAVGKALHLAEAWTTHQPRQKTWSEPSPAQIADIEKSVEVVRRQGAGPGDASLGGGERKILAALAQYRNGRTKQQVAILTAYSHNGGGFNNYVSALRSKGYLEGEAGALRITEAGLRALGEYQPLPTGRALFEHWLGQLGKAEREILRVLYEEWPQARPKDFVAVKAGYAPDGGGFNNALSRLRTLELIEGRSKLKASDQLQDGAR